MDERERHWYEPKTTTTAYRAIWGIALPWMQVLLLIGVGLFVGLIWAGKCCGQERVEGTGTKAWSPNGTPAVVAPPSRYEGGLLRPGAILGDTTWFDFQRIEPDEQPFYHDVAVSETTGLLVAATGRGVEIYDVSSPRNPQLLAYGHGPDLLPQWGFSDLNFYIDGVAMAPAGQSASLVAIAGGEQGVSVWDTVNPTSPLVRYQDVGVTAAAVAMGESFGLAYAFVADASATGGLKVYSVDLAGFYSGCLSDSRQDFPACPGVFTAELGTYDRLYALDAVEDVVAVIHQTGGSTALDVWTYHPLDGGIRRFSSQTEIFATNVVLWRGSDGRLMTGLLGLDEVFRTYDVSCVEGTGSCTLGAAVGAIAVPGQAGDRQTQLTLSWSQGTPFAYVGNLSPGTVCSAQREYLLDLSTPSSPWDVTPHTSPAGYWGWYYAPCSGGFNNVRPMGAFFHPGPGPRVLYRAGFSMLDSHELVEGARAIFHDGFEAGDTGSWGVP